MDCVEFQKMLADYETLTAEEKLSMLEHTASCGACAAELEEYMSMVEAVKNLPQLSAPSDFLEKLNERIDAETVKKRTVSIDALWLHLKRSGYRYSAAVACIMLIAIIGISNSSFVNRMMNRETDLTSVPISTVSPQVTSEPQATNEPLAVPTDAPSATQIAKQTKTDTTLAPQYTTTPTYVPEYPGYTIAKNTTEPTPRNDVQPTAEPTAQPTPVPTAEATAQVANELDPNAYTLPDEKPSRTTGARRTSEFYEGFNVSELTVSAASIERAKEIINEYSVEEDGCYSVKDGMFEKMLRAMSEAGIDYYGNDITVREGTVTFKLITE